MESLALIEGVGGDVIPVDNGTAGRTRFGGLANFRQASGGFEDFDLESPGIDRC